ncbi:adenylate/guanylate cyclase domain-containing protein, partial [Myxococcota bacterium]|nr:adenylate/guanylate cyclase domain-containing protein [Myxococcota bacterium]
MRTETLAIVFTDIKGYTATTAKQSHEENAKLLKKAETVITPVVSSFDGRIIKSIGDAYMVVFRSPTEAVRCATAIQDKLFLANRNFAEDDQLHIRVAINVGEVRVQGGDVFGEPVNIAARVESVTPADEIYLSQAVYLTMNRSEIPCEHVGEFELKGITEPVTIYRVEKKNRDSKESAQDITISEASSTEAPPEDGE